MARRMVVERRRWLTGPEFTDLLALGQFLPGPNIVNVAVCIGQRFHGWRGAVAAVLGIMAAPVGIVLCLGLLFARYGDIPEVRRVTIGVGSAAAGLVIATALKMAWPLRGRVWAVVTVAAVAAAIGLLRWPLLVPGFAADAASTDPATAADARDAFSTAGDILGTAIGETVGYLLTALWTVLVIVALGRAFGRWFALLGGTAAALVLVGVFSPLDLPVIDIIDAGLGASTEAQPALVLGSTQAPYIAFRNGNRLRIVVCDGTECENQSRR